MTTHTHTIATLAGNKSRKFFEQLGRLDAKNDPLTTKNGEVMSRIEEIENRINEINPQTCSNEELQEMRDLLEELDKYVQ